MARSARDAFIDREPAAKRAADRKRLKAVPAGTVPWPQREAVITAATKVTVYQRKPADQRHVDFMADPLPGVPGWCGGPCLRDGAMDFKRYQAHQPQPKGGRP